MVWKRNTKMRRLQWWPGQCNAPHARAPSRRSGPFFRLVTNGTRGISLAHSYGHVRHFHYRGTPSIRVNQKPNMSTNNPNICQAKLWLLYRPLVSVQVAGAAGCQHLLKKDRTFKFQRTTKLYQPPVYI